jgi:AMMECR1 domain-containing protein
LYIRYGRNSGLLLPQVATEQNWNLREFLENVSMKAGLPKEHYKNQSAELFTFEAVVIEEPDREKLK